MYALLDSLGDLSAKALRDRYGDAGAALPDRVALDASARADLQCSAAMGLAKALRKNPREIATVLSEALATHEAVAGVEVAGAGFVNVTLRDAWIAAHLDDASALRPVGAGQTVVVDFSSPNVAKPMHIGHLRSTILGESLKRILRASGYTVVADNHLGDWGTQFGKLIVGWRRYLDAAAYARDPIAELERIYVRYSAEEKLQRKTEPKEGDDEGDADPNAEAPPLLVEARAELAKLQQGDPENVALWKQFIAVSMAEFDRMYQRLGVSFDVTLGESFFNDRLAGVVDTLLEKGIAEHSLGAVIVTFEKARDGEAMPPLLIRKRDGAYLYGTTDIACVQYRVETWHPARILYVTDERQQLHFRQFFAASRRLGVTTRLEHVWFGLMRLPEGTFSTRDGNVIKLDRMLDEAEERALAVAREVAAKGGAEFGEAELREIARVVGIGAVKYNDLSKDRQTLVTFTWDKALSLTGNTAPYLQYAYARCRSILRKAEAQGIAVGDVTALAPSERALSLTLLRFPQAVASAAETARPHLICDHLFEVATSFSTFYNECPVLQSEGVVRAGRLSLTARVAEALRQGLDLLGIEVVERM